MMNKTFSQLYRPTAINQVARIAQWEEDVDDLVPCLLDFIQQHICATAVLRGVLLQAVSLLTVCLFSVLTAPFVC